MPDAEVCPKTRVKSIVRGEIERERLRAYILLILYDLVIINLSFLIVTKVYLGHWSSLGTAPIAPQLAIIFLGIGFFSGTYSLRGVKDLPWSIRMLMVTLFVAMSIWLAITFLTKHSESYSRVVFASGVVVSFLGMSISRWVINWRLIRRLGPTLSHELVISAGGPSIAGEQYFRLDANVENARSMVKNPDQLADFGISISGMDRVIVSCPPKDRADWSFVLKAAGVRGEVISEPLRNLGALGININDDHTSVVISVGPLRLRDRVAKRIIDLSLAIPALIFASPVFLLTALAIKLDDGGPVFFKQRRIGLGNRYFKMIKFRSMSVSHTDSNGQQSASRADVRITRVGNFLRKTSLDELPQLINVLLSDMSLVGPRPHATGSRAGDRLFWEVDTQYWHRHSIKPGLTGLAQVRGHRGATDMEDDLKYRLQADLEYLNRWSPMLDFEILLRTASVLIHDRAY